MLLHPFLALVTAVLPGKKVKFPYPRFDQAMVEELRSMLEAGRFRPVVDRTYPLDDIVEAYRYVQSGRKIGSVVIRVDRSA